MQNWINLFLKIIKWPLAIWMVILFMPVFKADMKLMEQTMNAEFLLRFVAPLVMVMGLWFVVPGLAGSHFAIFEHEFTHMIAAILTFHRPKSMEIHQDRGGTFSFYGPGNWFITLAPYFLPVFPFLMIVGVCLWQAFDKPVSEIFISALGAMFGYHLISNFMQIHGKQTDFIKAGWPFTLLFLPTANLITAGFVWAFAAGEWAGATSWVELIIKESKYFIMQIL